ncbi:MAG: diaminobutyrate--2-oxoglutarate transaminase [Vulcanimicrobiota bacterium]
MNIFETLESEVRSYCRSFPTVFTRAHDAYMFDQDGKRYIDLFAGAGVLNYGHNNPRLQQPLLDYIQSGGITHSLDMYTAAKRTFLEKFQEVILEPRGLDYRIQFPGPTGTNAVEAALKVARKATGRQSVICFTNAFHGMTLGSLSLTGNRAKREGAGVPLNHSQRMPYGDCPNDGSLAFLRASLENSSSGFELPAAIILETVQAEGGVRVADKRWLQGLATLAEEFEIPLIVDDIQVGCGRTGGFFSFEEAGLKPDIVCLSKSLSGYGLPFALVLIKPELDVWDPGEHNGTFRGHNLAFVTATEALSYWTDKDLEKEVARKSQLCRTRLQSLVEQCPDLLEVRGRGLILGVECKLEGLAGRWSQECFKRGLIIETAGPADSVLKLLPPLTIEEPALVEALDIIERSLAALPEGESLRVSLAAVG